MSRKPSPERMEELLLAAHALLKKQDESVYVLNLLEECVDYDGTECDGACLMEDIEETLQIGEMYDET